MASSPRLSMSDLPPIYVLPTRLQIEDLHEIEDGIYRAGGRLSYRASEARVFLTKLLQKKRAAFDLRACGLWTQEEPLPDAERTSKRRKLDYQSSDQQDLDLPDLTDHVAVLKIEWLDDCTKNDNILPFGPYLVYSGKIVPKPKNEAPSTPTSDPITYIKALPEERVPATPSPESTLKTSPILERARADAAASPSSKAVPFHRRKFGQKNVTPNFTYSHNPPKLNRTTTSEFENLDSSKLPPPPEWLDQEHPRPLYSCLRSTPPLDTNPNRYFIEQLNKIKEARLLTLDEIGVRAYSTSIASLAAYLHRITSPLEITRLPGCNDKIATLWIEWHDSVSLSDHPTPDSDHESSSFTTAVTSPPPRDPDAALDPRRTIPTVTALLNDPVLQHLKLFHDIWGVGPETARKFHLQYGWTDLDDVVEHGWHTHLSRVQQIGLKFYDEFQLPIPRAEVESIARVVLRHARLCKNIPPEYWTNDAVGDESGRSATTAFGIGDPRDFVCVLVGGYRRGKTQSGDVDVILSHRDERMTRDLVVDVVRSLEGEGWVTHTLTLNTAVSERQGGVLPFKTEGAAGSGFDSLDKALCVWQDPHFDDKDDDDDNLDKGPDEKTTSGKRKTNPNVHRRVDIIVSSWRTIGCAVLGWSGGTTFQRDIRRWVKRERGWKFDSSGVRDRASGLVLDLEEPLTTTTTTTVDGDGDGDGGGNGDGNADGGTDGDHGDGWEDRERRLMERLGIGWRPAEERCTG